MKKTYKITVIIPLYNPDIDFLINSLNILVDTQKDLIDRIILIDDGSPEPVGNHEKEIGDIWSRISIMRGLNRGPGGARNAGVQIAQTDLVAFLDQDCQPAKDWLPNMLSTFEKTDSIAVVGKVSSVESESRVAKYADYIKLLSAPSKEVDGTFRCLVAANLMISKKIFSEIDGFDEHLKIAAEDLDITYRLVKAGYGENLTYEEKAVVYHFHRTTLKSLYLQQYGYAFGTMSHCILRNRNPESIGFNDTTLLSSIYSICLGLKTSILTIFNVPSKKYGYLNKIAVFPFLEFVRTIARILGHKNASRQFPKILKKMKNVFIRPSVRIILQDKQGAFVVMRKPDGGYGLAGGGIEKNESKEQALERECEEELGISLKDVDSLKYLGKNRAILRIDYYFDTHVYFGIIEEEVIQRVKLSSEHESLARLPIKDVPFPLSMTIEKALAM